MKIQIGVENELHDNSNFKFEKLLNFDKSFYKGKRRRDISRCIILKTIMLGLKKCQIIRNLRLLFYVLLLF